MSSLMNVHKMYYNSILINNNLNIRIIIYRRSLTSKTFLASSKI